MMLKEELVKFLKQTSIKGIPRLLKGETAHLKVLWCLAVVLFLCVGFFHSHKLIEEYIANPKVTYMQEHELAPGHSLQFPSIQVCNANPMGLLKNAVANEKLVHYQMLVDNVTDCRNCSEDDLSLMENIKKTMLSIAGYLQHIGVNRAVNLLINYTNFMIQCLTFTEGSLTGKHCDSMARIEKVVSAEYLSCLKLDFIEKAVKQVSMTFYIDSFSSDMLEYSHAMFSASSTGVVYSVQESHIPSLRYGPLPTALPGIKTSVNLMRHIHRRIPDAECVEESENYNQGICLDQCYRGISLKYCNCSTVLDPSQNREHTYCFSVDLPQYKLMENYKCTQDIKPKVAEECSKCKQSCLKTRYEIDPSYSKWPVPHQYESFYNRIIQDNNYSDKYEILKSTNISVELKPFVTLLKKQIVDENFVKVDFNLNTKVYQEFHEVPKYTSFSFIGTLGGALNLWTGITVVVLVEITEVFVNIISSILSRKGTDQGDKETIA